MEIHTIGIDLEKTVFRLVGLNIPGDTAAYDARSRVDRGCNDGNCGLLLKKLNKV